MKIIITAANGFIGQSLIRHFKGKYEIIGLVRKLPENLPQHSNGIQYRQWDGQTLGEWTIDLEGALAVINLAGRSVNCRYNARNKQDIYSSRLDSTEVIGKAIEQCADKPKVWVNAASATIYRHSLHEPMTEKDGMIGEGFSVDVCQRWEQKFNDYRQENVRQVILRTAIVLGKNGGVMKPFNRLLALGLGGKMAKGNQMFSWIHEKDLCRAVDFLIENESCAGIYNLSAPNPVTNAEFMKTMRHVNCIPFGIPSPAWLLKAGAWLIGTETELIFKSRFVVPERLLAAGFEFKHATTQQCIENLSGTAGRIKFVDNKWSMTAFLGSAFVALTCGVIAICESGGLIDTLLAILMILTISTAFSMLASLPVLMFADSIRKKRGNQGVRTLNFQLMLYLSFLVLGTIVFVGNPLENMAEALIWLTLLTNYLLVGFAIWSKKSRKKSP